MLHNIEPAANKCADHFGTRGSSGKDARRQSLLTLIVPFRGRLKNLQTFIPHMDAFLTQQQISYRIIVVHQKDSLPFNRGQLLNIGFLLTQSSSDYVCFHDVDLLPEDESCDYSIPGAPTHLAGRAEQYNFALPYPTYCGGVTLFPIASFIQVNGFSNRYWGWGREDDDLFLRLVAKGLALQRRPGKYSSLAHQLSPRCGVMTNTLNLRATLQSIRENAPDVTQDLQHLRDICGNYPLVSSHHVPIEDDGLCSVKYTLLRRLLLINSGVFQGPVGSSHELISVSLD